MASELTRQTVQLGVTVRLIKDYLTVPAGTLATVQSINSALGGNWHFTVRWKPHRPIAAGCGSEQGRRMMPMECSLTLSEEDLQSFELAMDQDLLSPRPPFEISPHGSENGQDMDQLSIPFAED